MSERGSRTVAIAAAFSLWGVIAILFVAPQSISWMSIGDEPPEELVLQEVMRCSTGRAVLVLREKNGDRRLAIPISPDEARALTQRMRGAPGDAAREQDLANGSIQALGGQVTQATIDAVVRDEPGGAGSAYYGHLTLTHGRTSVEVDARPGDAVAIALAHGAPIVARREVLERAGITPEEAAALRDSQRTRAVSRDSGPSHVQDI